MIKRGRRNKAPWEQGIDNPKEVGRAIADAALDAARRATTTPDTEPLTVTTRPFTKDEVMALDAASPATGEGLREAVLAKDPWIGWDTVYCYWCGAVVDEGHTADCLYARLAATTPDTEEK